MSDLPSARSAALALSLPSLLTFNEKPYDEQDRRLVATSIPLGLASMCIRLGWTPPQDVTNREGTAGVTASGNARTAEGSEDLSHLSEELEASMQLHLASLWSDRLPPTHEIKSVRLDSPVEDKPCRCSLVIVTRDGLSQEGAVGEAKRKVELGSHGVGEGMGEQREREEGEVEGEEEEEGEVGEGEGDHTDVGELRELNTSVEQVANTTSAGRGVRSAHTDVTAASLSASSASAAAASAAPIAVKYEWFKSCRGTREFVRIGNASGEVSEETY